jgi:Xaa-Pro dipeptidase
MVGIVDLSGKYPAKVHAKQVAKVIHDKHPEATGLLFLESQRTRLIEDNDEPVPFR